MAEEQIKIRMAHRRDYQFDVHFDGGPPPLLVDEPPELGDGEGPSPVQLLLAAVGNCLASSLLFALRKFKIPLLPDDVEAIATMGRVDGRLRVVNIDARITLDQPVDEAPQHLDRALGQFENFCTVTQSVGQGITVRTEVFDAAGQKLK